MRMLIRGPSEAGALEGRREDPWGVTRRVGTSPSDPGRRASMLCSCPGLRVCYTECVIGE